VQVAQTLRVGSERVSVPFKAKEPWGEPAEAGAGAASWLGSTDSTVNTTFGGSDPSENPGFPPFPVTEKKLQQDNVYRLTCRNHPPIYRLLAGRGANDLAGGDASLA
jgi:hypothetical protein